MKVGGVCEQRPKRNQGRMTVLRTLCLFSSRSIVHAWGSSTSSYVPLLLSPSPEFFLPAIQRITRLFRRDHFRSWCSLKMLCRLRVQDFSLLWDFFEEREREREIGMNIFFFFLFLIISFIFFLLTMFLSYDRTVEKDSSVDFFPVLF